MRYNYQIIVIGGGHAGIEAAAAAARMGVDVLMLLDNLDSLGQMSCNPSIGGIGKSHLVREVDALDGLMGQAADAATIQTRVLNSSKGAAVRATRMQIDRLVYKCFMRNKLVSYPNLTIQQQRVARLLLKNGQVDGVLTAIGVTFYAPVVVLAAGTFLNGKIFVGLSSYAAGRMGDSASQQLAEDLRSLGLPVARLKTGTPPRIAHDSINYDSLERQDSDIEPTQMSFLPFEGTHLTPMPCFLTRTNPNTHQIIRDNLDRSPLFTGMIEGVGPRYCPSIEDKIHRFAGRDGHQIFLEPEGHDSVEVYPNGISTSLPLDVQYAIVHSVAGLENARILRPGYAIEYDYFDPQQLYPSLESKLISGLFIAGQLNGTTGYEEAAAQGILAGINAARKIRGSDGWFPRRDQAYLGVMVDDLLTKGVLEPYRMFTSRAEYRLQLREDNADLRLTELGYQLGVVGKIRYRYFCSKLEQLQIGEKWLRNSAVNPQSVAGRRLQQTLGGYIQEQRCWDLLKRPEIDYAELSAVLTQDDTMLPPPTLDREVAKQLEIQCKYEGYLIRQQREIEQYHQRESVMIPDALDYEKIAGLSHEIVQRLKKVRPVTLGQASRVYGVTPAAISIIMIYLIKAGMTKGN